MTVIIGLKHAGKVYMGADNCHLDGWHRVRTPQSKIVSGNDALIGISMSQRAEDAIEAHHDWLGIFDNPPKSRPDMVARIVPEIIDALHAGGCLTKDASGASGMDAEIMIAACGKIYVIGTDFSVSEISDYAAIGAGAKYAYGYIYAYGYEDAPYATLHGAMECAEHFCAAVRGPFEVRAI